MMRMQDRQFDRYARISAWAHARWGYDLPNGARGWLGIGAGCVPGKITRVEDMAAVKLLGHVERWAGFRLADCPAR